MAPKRLHRNQNLLKVLAKSDKKLSHAILSQADDDLILCLSECAYNLLNGNIPLKPKQIEALKKYKTSLRKLSDDKISIQDKKSFLNQKGGNFLPTLLSPILIVLDLLLKNDAYK